MHQGSPSSVWPHSRILCSPSPQAALSRAIPLLPHRSILALFWEAKSAYADNAQSPKRFLSRCRAQKGRLVLSPIVSNRRSSFPFLLQRSYCIPCQFTKAALISLPEQSPILTSKDRSSPLSR